MSFIFLTEFFESSSLALNMKLIEKTEVKVWCSDKIHHKILDGLMEKEPNFVQFLGKKNVFITDDASSGTLADALRARGELVYGGSKESDILENDRQAGQASMKKAGINVSYSHNFKGQNAFQEAIGFVKNNKGRWVIKQNGDAPKELSTVGKFDNGEDVMDKLNDFKHIWPHEYPIDFDLQQFVDGYEVGVAAWFNGKDWVKDKNGEPVFIVNWEHKKKSEGDTGRTTGETCTLQYRSHKNSGINKEILKLTKQLQDLKYIGNIDVNFILEKKSSKFYGLEYTMRFGYPSLNCDQEMFKTPWKEFFEKSVKGENNFLDIDPRWAVVVVLQVPPYPFETQQDLQKANCQRIYFTDGGKWSGKDQLTLSKLKHIHPYEVRVNKETKHFECTGDTGYSITITAQGDSVKAANEACLKYLTDNIYTSNMDFRKDCGVNKRVEESIKFMSEKALF